MIRHFVEWQGERYSLEPLRSRSKVTSLSPTWAVIRRGEFIGTLPYRLNEAFAELELRCINWLAELLGAPPILVHLTSFATEGTLSAFRMNSM